MSPSSGHENKNRLREFVGEWVGDETVAPGTGFTRGGPAKGRSSARMALGDSVLLTDYVEERDGKVILEGHGVYAWEAQDVYRMYWFDTSGPAPDSPIEGRWVDDTLTFERATATGRVRYVYTFRADGNAYVFRMERMTEGAWSLLMEGHYRRA